MTAEPTTAAVCAHSWVNTYATGPDGVWACVECRRRFYPACIECVDVGHRSTHHPTKLPAGSVLVTEASLARALIRWAGDFPEFLDDSGRRAAAAILRALQEASDDR